jgi:dTDP-L-rhamnose 4-epimerase
MRVLVTGGAGFIGSHIVEELVAAGHDVVVIDSAHPAAHATRPEALVPGVEYLWRDLADADAVLAATRGFDGVCHQAAMVGLGADFSDVVDYVHANDVGTATLLRSLHEHRFGGRFVLASSMVVYGEGRYRCPAHGVVRPGPRDPTRLALGDWEPPCPTCGGVLRAEAVPEETPPDPRTVYAATKLHQEHLCGLFGRDHGIGVTALRYHNVYGPNMPRNTPYAGVAAIFLSALEAGRAPTVFEDGGQLRDFVHVRDVARANRLALEAANPWHGPLNIASGTPRTVLALATTLWRSMDGQAPPPTVVPEYRSGDVRHVFATTAAAADKLGFTARIEFENGVAELAAPHTEGRGVSRMFRPVPNGATGRRVTVRE